jgi:hypothetical protein
VAAVRELKATDEEDIVLLGSGMLLRLPLAARLIDVRNCRSTRSCSSPARGCSTATYPRHDLRLTRTVPTPTGVSIATYDRSAT